MTDFGVLICDSYNCFPKKKKFFLMRIMSLPIKAQILFITSTATSCILLLDSRDQLRGVAAGNLHLSWGLTKLAGTLGNGARGLCV